MDKIELYDLNKYINMIDINSGVNKKLVRELTEKYRHVDEDLFWKGVDVMCALIKVQSECFKMMTMIDERMSDEQ